MGRIRPAATAVLILCTLLACTKTPKVNQGQASKPSAESASPTNQSAAAGQPVGAPAQGGPTQSAPAGQPAAGPQTAPKPAAVAPAPARIDTGIQSLFALDRETVSLPEDFSIGPLSDQSILEGRDKGAISAARSFLSALTVARVDQKLLSPDSSSALEGSLSYHLKKGEVPSSFRIGKPKELSSGEIAFNVRLFRGEGAAEGEIYLAEKDKAWRVSDFQLNLSELTEIREKTEEKFFPSSYRWLLGE